MKIKIIQTGVLLLLGNLVHSQGLLVQSGATFKTQGNISIVVQDGNFTNNGTTALDGSNIYFTGTSAGTLSGSSNISINNLYINRAAATVALGHDVNIAGQVILQNGILDLNGKTIALSPSASITGESETNRIVSPAGGEITITVPLNAPLAENPGNLGAIINSAADLGSVTIKRGHKSYSNIFGANSISRYYDISPTNNTGLDAFLRFKYLDAESNGLNEANYRMFRSVDGGANWTDEGFSGRNTTSNFVDRSGINSFSLWTLSVSNALPLTLTNFKAGCSSGVISAEWETLSEQNTDKFVVQRSTDTRTWETIGTVAAKGNFGSPETYNWSDAHPLANYAFYRLEQTDKDGKKAYSTLVGAGCNGKPVAAFAVYPNPIKDLLKASIISPFVTTGKLSLYAASGALLQTRGIKLLGGLNTIDMNMTNYPKGTYTLVLDMQDNKKWVEKIIKQ